MTEFLLEFNQNVKRNSDVEEFKKELWDTVLAFGEPIEIGLEVGRKRICQARWSISEKRSQTASPNSVQL